LEKKLAELLLRTGNKRIETKNDSVIFEEALDIMVENYVGAPRK